MTDKQAEELLNLLDRIADELRLLRKEMSR